MLLELLDNWLLSEDLQLELSYVRDVFSKLDEEEELQDELELDDPIELIIAVSLDLQKQSGRELSKLEDDDTECNLNMADELGEEEHGIETADKHETDEAEQVVMV